MDNVYSSSEQLLLEYVRLKRLRWHSYASEAVLKGMAEYLDEDVDKWGTAGLLHDLDIEITNARMDKHTIETARILTELNYPDDLIEAIKLHNAEAHGKKRNDRFSYALASGESLAGFISFCVSANHDNNIFNASVESIHASLMREDFARHIDRTAIMECELTGINIRKFIEIGLESMRKVSNRIGFNG